MNGNPGQLNPSRTDSYFGAQSSWGITKHMGGLRATQLLVEQCRIGQGSIALVVGSGSGVIACYLAKTWGCRVTGIDLEEGMVAWANSRAARQGLTPLAQFQTADAQDMPFEDKHFDAVICESVLAFVPEKGKAIAEIHRVLKPGCRAGINECVWNEKPPVDLLAFIKHSMGNVDFLPPEEWVALFENQGFKTILAEHRKLNLWQQWRDEREQSRTAQEKGEALQAWKKFMKMYFTDKGFRRYARQITPGIKVMTSLTRCLGYTLIVSEKAGMRDG